MKLQPVENRCLSTNVVRSSRKRRRSVFNFWASIRNEMFSSRHPLESVTLSRRDLAGHRGVNESTSVKTRGSRARWLSSSNSRRKAFPRAVESRNVVKGSEKMEEGKEREKENEGEKRVADFYARKQKWNWFARDAYGRLLSGMSNKRVRRFLKRIWLFSSTCSSNTLTLRNFFDHIL